MLTYLIILLDDTATSYCHYEVNKTARRLISLDDLKEGIIYSMKENLNVQFVYPDYELPQEYKDAIDMIDHVNIRPCGQPISDDEEIIVLNDWKDARREDLEGKNCIIRSSRLGLTENKELLKQLLAKVTRLNIVLTDIESFKDEYIESYKKLLEDMAQSIANLYASGKQPQLNLLTDRAILSAMNNCNAGDTNVTLAPNGKFYLCPAFYYDDERSDVGNLSDGLNIKNPQLLRIDHAPICRACDAYQCKRCIWLNGKLTLDCNTPSHQQCVVAHVERNATCMMLKTMEGKSVHMENSQPLEPVKELDPFNIVNKWK